MDGKKLLALVLALLLMAAPLWGLAEEDDTYDAEEDALIAELLADGDESELFDEEFFDGDSLNGLDEDGALYGAMEVYSWFAVCPLDVDGNAPNRDGTMWRVLDDRFDTLEELTDIVRFYFSDAIADDLLAQGIYAEEDGVLYTTDGGRGVDITIEETDTEIVSEDDNRIEYLVTVAYVDVAETKELRFVRENIDGEWKFTEFPFFW